MYLTSYPKQALVSIQGNLLKKTNYAFNTRGKKLAWLGILGVIMFLYWSSSRFLPAHRHLSGVVRKGAPCLQREIESWINQAVTSNVVIGYPGYDSPEKQFLPYSGNGYIGIVVDGKNRFVYLLGKDPDYPIKIPLNALLEVKLQLSGFSKHDAIVLNIKEGVIHFYRAFSGLGSCVLVKHTVFVHRRYSGIVVQQLTISNLLEQPLEIELEPMGILEAKYSKKETLSFKRNKYEKDSHSLYQGYLEAPESHSHLNSYVAISVSSFPTKISVPIKSFKQINVLMTIATNQLPVITSTPSSKIAARKEELMKQTIDTSKKDLRKYLGLTKPSQLYEEHVKAWNEIWQLGLSVESQDDPDSPLPLHVNLTEYYIYSIFTQGANDSNLVNLSNKKQMQLKLQTLTGSCFFGSPTMYSAEHWVLPKSIADLKTMRLKWASTLTEHGCGRLLDVGLFGWQEAIALSFSGLQFTDRGLELALNPLSLASNVSVRHLYCFKRHLFLQIVIDKSQNVQNIRLSSYGTPKSKLYACDAGCEHISELKNAVIIFEIRVTSPVTPILYVSPNKTKLELIKKSKFIVMSKQGDKQTDQAPSFAAHHVKLSPKFWVAIGILIVGFHVVVIKMIYNECRKERGRRNKGWAFVS